MSLFVISAKEIRCQYCHLYLEAKDIGIKNNKEKLCQEKFLPSSVPASAQLDWVFAKLSPSFSAAGLSLGLFLIFKTILTKQHQWKKTSMVDSLNRRRPQWRTTSMEDDLNGRRAQWKTNSIEDDLNGRWSQLKKTSMEDDLDGRWPQLKKTSMEDIFHRSQPQWITTSMENKSKKTNSMEDNLNERGP